MTYCLGMLLDDGLVFASDTRTNAGVDSVATYRKMFVFDRQDDRLIVVMTAGDLSVAPPIDLVIYRRSSFRVATHQRIDDDDPYFAALRRYWGEGIKVLFADAPEPPWRIETRERA